MKFAKYLSTHKAPEWRTQYIKYDQLKDILYDAKTDSAENGFTTDKDQLYAYFKHVDRHFLNECELELCKINRFYATKITESRDRLTLLKQQIDLSFVDEFDSPAPALVHQPASQLSLDATKLAAQKFFGSSSLLRRIKKKDANQQKRRTKALKLAMSELYFLLVLIKEYRELNFTGFRKILKKHDKVFLTDRGMTWFHENIVEAEFVVDEELEQLLSSVENVYIEKLENGDRQEAMNQLRVTRENQQVSNWVLFRIGLWTGILFAVSVLIAIYSAQLFGSGQRSPKTLGHQLSKFSNLTEIYSDSQHWLSLLIYIYRSLYLVDLEILLVSVCAFCWRHYGVNYVLIFELDPRDHMRFEHLLDLGLQFLLVTHFSVLVTIWRIRCSESTPIHQIKHLFLVPFLAHIATLALMANPLNVQYRKSRLWYLRTSMDVIFRPACRPVFFRHFWLGDQFLSLSSVFGDLFLIGAFYSCYYEWTLGKPVSAQHYISKAQTLRTSQLVLTFTLTLIPHFSRFLQCIRRYREVRRRVHIINALKYMLGWPMVATIVLKPTARQQQSVWVAALGLTGALDMAIKYAWDLRMDWNLFIPGAEKQKILRQPLIYGSPIKYWTAVVSNLMFRLLWIVKTARVDSSLWPGGVWKATLGSLLSASEVLRRFMWNLLRLECEHVNNCAIHRAIRDISICPLMRVRQVEERDYVEEKTVRNEKRRRSTSAVANDSDPNENGPGLKCRDAENDRNAI